MPCASHSPLVPLVWTADVARSREGDLSEAKAIVIGTAVDEMGKNMRVAAQCDCRFTASASPGRSSCHVAWPSCSALSRALAASWSHRNRGVGRLPYERNGMSPRVTSARLG